MKVIVNGAGGHMGREVIAQLEQGYRGGEYAGGIDVAEGFAHSLADFAGEADVVVDFSHHSAVGALLRTAVERGLPVVVATTGHDEAETALIYEAAKSIPVFHAANMSIGVALLVELAVKAAKAMPDADIEIVETHHNRKLDAPSGTALTIANAIADARENAKLKMGRSGHAVREPGEIGISAVRRGNITGIHEVLLSTDTETITLRHEAHTRALFAQGALAAAAFIVGKQPGLYKMDDFIREGDAQ